MQDGTETTDALLDDPGDFTDDETQRVTEAVARIGGPQTLRLAAVMNTLDQHNLLLDDDGTAARDVQVKAIQRLIDADTGSREALALALVRMLTANMPIQNEATAAIVTMLNAVDGDPVALDVVTADAPPVHRAVCMVDGCTAAVTYRPTASGGGIFVLGRAGMDSDASIGMGPNGRPVCPVDGHGEMTLADETIPAADAFAQVTEKLDKPVQGDLPGILPQFNYQGCYLELEAKAAEVDALHDDYVRAKEEAADAKKAWDKAAELYTKMALEFRRRRQAKGDDNAPTTAAPAAIKCVWDQAHQDDACPLCDMSISIEQRAEIVRILGAEILPVHANSHADQVVEYRTRVDVMATANALHEVVYDVHLATIAEWTPQQRAEVRAWAENETTFEDLPAVLGRPHIAGPAGEQAQCCTECGVVLRTYDDIADALPAGARVRTNCTGAQAEPEHHYPDTSKPKKARSRAKAESDVTTKKRAKKSKGGR